jgi:hypothetical protein
MLTAVAIRDHPASEVYVTGTFDDWSKSEKLVKSGDSFVKDVTLPSAEEKIYYKVRGGEDQLSSLGAGSSTRYTLFNFARSLASRPPSGSLLALVLQKMSRQAVLHGSCSAMQCSPCSYRMPTPLWPYVLSWNALAAPKLER